MDRLEKKDWRLLLVCVAVIAASAVTTAKLFRKAFPEAAIEFRVNRDGARRIAESFLKDRGRDVALHRFAGRFEVADTPKVYLERTLGLEKAGSLYGREAKIWLWEMRWFRSAVKEEERVSVSPLGDLVSWDSVRKEDAPGAKLSQEEARALADRFLDGRGLPASARTPIEATPAARPNRTDWTFVDERKGFTMGEATVRYTTMVVGGEVGAYREFVHVPEEWERGYERLRSKNEAAGAAATVGLFLTIIAMIAVLVTKITRKDVRWPLVAAFGATGFVLALLSSLNELPLRFFLYDTASPLESHVARELVLAFFSALGTAAFVALVIAAAEPIYRERFPQHPSLSGTFSLRGIRTRRFFLAVVLGYALTAFFFAYQAVFYVVAERLGAWAPAEVPFDNMLNTAFPWATVLLIGFLPAVSEEGMSRMFSISFLDRLGAGRFLAVVVPAFLWGFGHSTYPNQPFYIRGVEVGCAGVLIGVLMLRYGVVPLLVWHFTVDATYTALLMLRSGNAYYVASGAVAAGILLAPLAVCLALAVVRRGFEPDTGLTNADLGFVPAPPAAPTAAEEVPLVTPLPKGRLLAAGAAALVLATAFLLPAPPLSGIADDHIGRARAEELARDFVRVNGGSPESYRVVAYAATGFAEDEAMRRADPGEQGFFAAFSDRAVRYVLKEGGPGVFRALADEKLPVSLWAVRFVQPEKKEEWKLLVDARRGRVIAYANPTEEGAAAGPPPSAEGARARALVAAGLLGYPAGEYSVVELGTKTRPKRTDTTVVLEARAPGIGQARPRLSAVFHGSMLSAFYPSIRVPEEFLRGEEKRSPFDWVLLAARVVVAGAFFGVALIAFLRIVREPAFRWRSLAAPLVVTGVLGAAGLANGLPTLLREYSNAVSLALFEATAAVLRVIPWIGLLLGAATVFALVWGARPGWRQAMRAAGGLPDALARAAVAALGLFGLARWTALATARFPALDVPDPALPSALEKAVPGFSALTSAALGTGALAAAAAVAAIASRDPFFRKPAVRAAVAAGLVIVLFPSRFHSIGELGLEVIPAAAAMAWMFGSAFLLLKDHVAAWVLFGALAFGGRACLALLSQTAAPDRAAGWVGALLVAAAAAILLAGRRGAATAAPADGSTGGRGDGATGGGE
jgi:hypothetical protein